MKKMLKSGLAAAMLPVRTAAGRIAAAGPRPPRFAGAYPTREAALAAIPKGERGGYRDPTAVEVSFEAMARVAPWDYPVLFWLDRLGERKSRILDAGGHMGTKAMAFAPLLPALAGPEGHWTVWDTPTVIGAALGAQAAGRVPRHVRFTDDLGNVEAMDILLCSGLLQYLDISLTDLVTRLPERPAHIVLSKVATREGEEVVTLERIGPVRVPYRIRNRDAFEAELEELGYEMLDNWGAPELSHVIPTHPALGASVSRGYALRLAA